MKPAISYIVASVQRSGTHLLCSVLRSTGVAGSPDEYFLCKPGQTWEESWGTPLRVAYIERVLQRNTTLGGVFGFVLTWSYFDRVLQMLQEIPAYKNLNGHQLLAAVFHRPRYMDAPPGSGRASGLLGNSMPDRCLGSKNGRENSTTHHTLLRFQC